jgi:hypothetical protein
VSLERCDGVETEVKRLGQLKDVMTTKIFANYFYTCPLCGYSAVDVQPANSVWNNEG